MCEFRVTTFETSLGEGAVAFSPEGVAAVAFPDCARTELPRHFRQRAPGAVETPAAGDIAALVDDIAALFEGAARDLSYVRLDWRGVAAFEREVYVLTRKIGPGETKTYGDIARALGDVGLSRRVGQALGRNPFPIIVPCHRVVGADGRMTGFSAPGGTGAKMQLLKIEGALAPDLFDRL